MALSECLYLLTIVDNTIDKLMMRITMTMVMIEVETAMAIETSREGVVVGVVGDVVVGVVGSDLKGEIRLFAIII